MRTPRIRLDHLLTTPLLPEARAAMMQVLEADPGLVSARHSGGRQARAWLGVAREQVAALVNAESPDTMVFTGSGAEAINLAIKGTAWSPRRRGNHLVLTVAEHPAALRSAEFLEAEGFQVARVPVGSDARWDPEQVLGACTEQTALVCVHQVQHDVGAVQPVAALGALAAARGIPVFVDATASAGWLPLDVRALQVGLVAMAPHRFYGPRGVGVLYRNARAPLAALIHGGDQEGGLRAGTENLAAIVGAGVAAEHASREAPRRANHVRALQQLLWESLSTQIEGVRLNGPLPGPDRHPVNLSLGIDGVEGEGLMLALDLKGLAIHAGPACFSRAARSSPVFEALGLSPAQVRSVVNLSPGKDTTEDEVKRALELLRAGIAKLRNLD